MKQRTTEWRMARLGDVTASRFKDVLTKPRTKAARDAGEMSETAMRYMEELLAELLTGMPIDRWQNAAMRWGSEWESHAFDAAVEAIEKRFGTPPTLPEGEFAYIQHPTEPGIGCSPDGIIGEDGLLEIKCPANPAVHIRTMLDGEMPEKHIEQVQGSLWIAKKKFYCFCSFDPRLEASGVNPLFIKKVERDDGYINEILAPAVIRFRDKLREKYREIVNEPF